MDELKELLAEYHRVLEQTANLHDCCEMLAEDGGFFDRFKKLTESTAFIIPKCPMCGSDEIEAGYNPAEDWWLLYCRECRHELVYSKSGKDGPDMYLKEAAKAFGDSSP